MRPARLARCVLLQAKDVDIVVKDKPRNRTRGETHIILPDARCPASKNRRQRLTV
jgi:hypothetical protein